MFESQKLSFDAFMLGYKHGIYIFTEDTCQICSDYKKTIEHINNAYLYFVEVNTKEQQDIVRKITDRQAFPMTACFKDNDLEYVRIGQLFDLQLEEIYASLKEFGDKPLTKDDIKARLTKQETRCKLTYYIISPMCDFKTRMKLIEHSIKHNELPIDVDMLAPKLSLDEREHLLEGNYSLAKLVVYKYDNTNIFSELGQRVLINYTTKNKNANFVIRMIEDELKEESNVTNSSNDNNEN